MQKVQSTAVRFKVARAIELEPGFVLRPGVYTGIKTRTRVEFDRRRKLDPLPIQT